MAKAVYPNQNNKWIWKVGANHRC